MWLERLLLPPGQQDEALTGQEGGEERWSQVLLAGLASGSPGTRVLMNLSLRLPLSAQNEQGQGALAVKAGWMQGT